MKTYFGLKFSGDERYDCKDAAARLFVCYDIPIRQVKQTLNLLGSGKLSEERFQDITNKTIDVMRDILSRKNRLYLTMRDRLREWCDTFGVPTSEDYVILYRSHKLSRVALFEESDTEDGGEDMMSGEDVEQRPNSIGSARALADYVKQYIKGQDDVIEQLAVPFFQHLDSARKGYTCKVKSSVMMLGPTGTGKSEMLKTFAEACDCPVVFVSTSEIRPMGWRGMHITDLIARKINDGVPMEKMQYAIIVLDEIDKITRYGARILSDAGNDDTHDLMRDIMKLLDVGHKLTIDNGVNTLEGTQSVIELPTDNLLLVFSGAFSGIEDIIKRRMNIHSTIGYSSVNQSVDAEDNYMKHVTTEDLEKWGYLPELLGRIGVYAVMNPLSVETMIEIMKQAKGSILEGHVDYAMRNHIDLRFSDEALRIIAEKAYESGLGFRNVRSLLANLLNKLYFDMSTSDVSNDTQVVTVDVEFISKHLRIR